MLDDCIEWSGAKAGNGYGVTSHNGSMTYVHRLAAEAAYGPIPSGMVVAHKCDNPACFKAEHLVICTQAENLADMRRKGRAASGMRHGSKTRPDCVATGERVSSSKLTTDQVREIRSKYERGQAGHKSSRSLSALASEYGVGHQAIHKIVNRITWKHV